MTRRVLIVRPNISLGVAGADLVETADGRRGYLVQIPPEDPDLHNITHGRWPWGGAGTWTEIPDHAQLVFDPNTLDDGYFTFHCAICGAEYVDRRVVGAIDPECPRGCP